MARYTGSVCRLCRRENQKLFLKGDRCMTDKCAIERRGYPPGQHGQGRIKFSEYGLQLREKQKIKRIYGLMERQFRSLFGKADRAKGITGTNLLTMLERRLDNVTYRAGFGNSRSEARQLVRHGHFTVNGKKVDVPSYLISKGDLVEVHQTSKGVTRIAAALEAVKRREIPQWLELDATSQKVRIRDIPARDDITAPMEERMVVELYSK
ncbi:MAG: 30S ribosomal protein S4 [Bdellovibrionales bacterium]|nr:30S ribosomal protein S4 [Bdellovibrionales bacterium]NDD91062.1 30S ribosomal protein S4 [bacterium]